MDIEPSKKGGSPQNLTYQNLFSGFKSPENVSFTLNELKTELYRRIKNRLYQYCQRLCQKNRLDDFTAKEINQNAVIKGFNNVLTFDFEFSWTEEKFANKVIAWFNTIAYNLFIDMLKEKAKCCPIDGDYDEVEDDGPRPDDFEFVVDDTTELRLQDAMDSLNDKERYIINIYLKHNCLGNNNHLPDEVINDICCSLGITKGNIRVINLRALEKLRTMLKKTKVTAN